MMVPPVLMNRHRYDAGRNDAGRNMVDETDRRPVAEPVS